MLQVLVLHGRVGPGLRGVPGTSGPVVLQGASGDDLLLRDRPLRPTAADERDGPLEQGRHPALEADQVQQVHREPQQPGHEPAELQLAHRRHRVEPADGGHRALVLVAERGAGLLLRQAAADLAGHVLPALDRHLGHAGQAVQGRHVTDDVDLGVAGQRQVRQHRDAPGTVELGAGLLGQQRAQRAALHPRGPHLGARLDPAGGPVRVPHLDPVAVDVGDGDAELDVHAHPRQLLVGLLPERLGEAGQHPRCGVDQDDLRVRRVDAAEVPAQGVPGELRDLPGHLHPGRTGPDHHEGEQALLLLLVPRQLGHLEGAEDAPAQLQGVVDGLHARGETREPVVAEVRLARTRGHDQVVEGGDGGPVEHLRGDRLGREVDPRHVAQQHRRVALSVEDLPRRGGDVALGQDSRRHLVEQRLEQVVRRARDQGDVDVGLAQALGREQAAETRADHQHVRPVQRPAPRGGGRGGGGGVGGRVSGAAVGLDGGGVSGGVAGADGGGVRLHGAHADLRRSRPGSHRDAATPGGRDGAGAGRGGPAPAATLGA